MILPFFMAFFIRFFPVSQKKKKKKLLLYHQWGRFFISQRFLGILLDSSLSETIERITRDHVMMYLFINTKFIPCRGL